MATSTLRVEGLRELRSDLRALDRTLPKSIQAANKDFAQEVAGVVRGVYQGQHPAKSGRGAASIRGLGSQSRATVAIGSVRAPYMLGQEFGANRRVSVGGGYYNIYYGARGRNLRRTTMRQFPPYKYSPTGRGGEGYFLWPTLRQRLPHLMGRYLEGIEAALAGRAGPETWARDKRGRFVSES